MDDSWVEKCKSSVSLSPPNVQFNQVRTRNAESQPSHFSVVFLTRQLAFDEPLGDGFSLRTRLKAFHSHTGKAIFQGFGTQLPLFAIDPLLVGIAMSGNHYEPPHSRLIGFKPTGLLLSRVTRDFITAINGKLMDE